MSARPFFGVVVLLVVLGAGCASEVPVERLEGDAATATGYALADVSGARDGAQTTARFVFEEPGAEDLILEVTLGYDPQPVLVAGSWSRGATRGTVHAETVRFVGGQGQGPSVGGTYRLERDSVARFRVHVPLTRIEDGWTP